MVQKWHISDGLFVVLVRAEPCKGYVTESAELSGVVTELGFRGMENLVT